MGKKQPNNLRILLMRELKSKKKSVQQFLVFGIKQMDSLQME